ncbi:YitT family protein [Massilia niastensis]|uniref:YitT family protein n=1 Tax=Massilia niastensis TaxID=544911 RepID=UPI00038013F8|nr:YitT family protein [Massilia niastensis]
MNTTVTTEHITKVPHSLLEDSLALAMGTLVISFGLLLLKEAHAVTGGISGIAFLVHYATGMRFGLTLFLLNLPFYYFGYKRMGKVFVLKTFCAVGLLSLFVELNSYFVKIERIDAIYAALLGNILIGLGFVILFRHRASLGGVNILALYLQDRYGIRAGKFQMAVDTGIVIAALSIVPLPALLISIAGAFLINLIISMNHRPNRYLA